MDGCISVSFEIVVCGKSRCIVWMHRRMNG